MKIKINFKYILPLFFITAFTMLQAQEELKGTKQKFDIVIDDLGDANLAVTTRFNASQWDVFKKTVGANQAYLKRQLIKGMPKYFLSDFKYEEEPMERSFTFLMKAFAVAQVDDNGKWKAELDMKDPDITKLNDQTFMLKLNIVTNGMLIEQEQTIHLPGKAKNVEIEKDSFGSAVLTYQLKTGSSSPILLYGGVLLMLAGLGLFLMNLKKSKSALV